jgi:hypothetical protein
VTRPVAETETEVTTDPQPAADDSGKDE